LEFWSWKDDEKLIIISNFDAGDTFGFELQLSAAIMERWDLGDGTYQLVDQLSEKTLELKASEGMAQARVDIEALQYLILTLESSN